MSAENPSGGGFDWSVQLRPGERLLWQGRPSHLWTSAHLFLFLFLGIPLLMTVIHVSRMVPEGGVCTAALFGCRTLEVQHWFMLLIGAVLVGGAVVTILGILSGQLWRRYAVTDQRALIEGGRFGTDLRAEIPLEGARVNLVKGVLLFAQPHLPPLGFERLSRGDRREIKARLQAEMDP